jgi:hypothetical protein
MSMNSSPYERDTGRNQITGGNEDLGLSQLEQQPLFDSNIFSQLSKESEDRCSSDSDIRETLKEEQLLIKIHGFKGKFKVNLQNDKIFFLEKRVPAVKEKQNTCP